VPKKFAELAGIWFFDVGAYLRNPAHCNLCKYLASQMIPKFKAVDELAKVIREFNPAEAIEPLRVEPIHEQIDWYIHSDDSGHVRDGSLVAFGKDRDIEVAAGFDDTLDKANPISIGNIFINRDKENEDYSKQWFREGAHQILKLEIFRMLVKRVRFRVGDRIRIRRGFPPREMLSVCQPDKPKGKVYLVKAIESIEDSRGFQILRLSGDADIFSQQAFLIGKKKKKEAKVDGKKFIGIDYATKNNFYEWKTAYTTTWGGMDSNDTTGG
jgi:hypothetical protein